MVFPSKYLPLTTNCHEINEVVVCQKKTGEIILYLLMDPFMYAMYVKTFSINHAHLFIIRLMIFLCDRLNKEQLTIQLQVTISLHCKLDFGMLITKSSMNIVLVKCWNFIVCCMHLTMIKHNHQFSHHSYDVLRINFRGHLQL